MKAPRKTLMLAGVIVTVACVAVAASGPAKVAPAPNGIEFPSDYATWDVISVSHRTDKGSVRAILGNDVAMAAVAEGETNPWPDGTMLAKVAWEEAEHQGWSASIAPGAFQHAGFMLKDSRRYTDLDGWAYARWVGEDLEPYGADASFGAGCHACHAAAADNDFVFTRAAVMPAPGEVEQEATE